MRTRAKNKKPNSPLEALIQRCESAPKLVVAKDLGISPCALSDLLVGRRSFTPAIGAKLGFVLKWVKAGENNG